MIFAIYYWALILSQALYTWWMLLIFIHTTPTVTSTIFSPVYRLGKSQRSYKPKWSQNQIPDSQILCLRIELTHSAVHNLKAQLGTRFHTRPLVQPSLRLRQRAFPAPQDALLLGRPLTQGGGGPGTLTWREMIQKKEHWEGAGYCGSRRELSLGRGEGLSPGARGPCSTPSYCLVCWDRISGAWGPKRAEIISGVQVLHVKQCWSLPLPGIPVSNQKQNADKWKGDVFAGTESTGWEDRPMQGSHRKFQTHFIILSWAIINSSQIQGCVFTLPCLNPASPSYCLSVCPTDQDASLESYNLLRLLHSPDCILYEAALLPAVKCWSAACIWLFLAVL